MLTPEEKIRVLKGSVRCFVMGLLGLIPVLGAGFALGSIRTYFRVTALDDREWNPARRYLYWGLALAWIGALLTLGLVGIIVVQSGLVELPGF